MEVLLRDHESRLDDEQQPVVRADMTVGIPNARASGAFLKGRIDRSTY